LINRYWFTFFPYPFLFVLVGGALTGLFGPSGFGLSFLLMLTGNSLTGLSLISLDVDSNLMVVGFEVGFVFSAGATGIARRGMVSFFCPTEVMLSIFICSIGGTIMGSLFSSLQEIKSRVATMAMNIDFMFLN
jgi:hypothetical protein